MPIPYSLVSANAENNRVSLFSFFSFVPLTARNDQHSGRGVPYSRILGISVLSCVKGVALAEIKAQRAERDGAARCRIAATCSKFPAVVACSAPCVLHDCERRVHV